MKYYLTDDDDRNIVFRLTGNKDQRGFFEYEMYSQKYGWYKTDGMLMPKTLLAVHREIPKKEIVKMKLKGEL